MLTKAGLYLVGIRQTFGHQSRCLEGRQNSIPRISYKSNVDTTCCSLYVLKVLHAKTHQTVEGPRPRTDCF